MTADSLISIRERIRRAKGFAAAGAGIPTAETADSLPYVGEIKPGPWIWTGGKMTGPLLVVTVSSRIVNGRREWGQHLPHERLSSEDDLSWHHEEKVRRLCVPDTPANRLRYPLLNGGVTVMTQRHIRPGMYLWLSDVIRQVEIVTARAEIYEMRWGPESVEPGVREVDATFANSAERVQRLAVPDTPENRAAFGEPNTRPKASPEDFK